MASHAWESCIDVSKLPPEQKGKVAQTLTWLEQHFPEFNEMLYEIKQGQKAGTIHSKIKIIPAKYTEYDQNKDELNLGWDPEYYLGTDSKIYAFTLNELLVHELQHGIQKNMPDHKAQDKAIEAAASKIRPRYEALKSYLSDKGVDVSNYGETYYIHEIRSGEHNPKLNTDILKDPQFRKLGQAWLNAYNAMWEAKYPMEDSAMDRVNILSQMLGKAPRGHYNDSDLLYYQMTKLGGTMFIDTAPPETIRQKPPRTWAISPKTPLDPTITGHAGKRDGNIIQMQHDWADKWNADTKNISSEEWRVIEEAKGTLLSPEILKTITPEEKQKVDAVIQSLKQNFNETNENDALTEANKQTLLDKKLNNVVDKTSQKGWKL